MQQDNVDFAQENPEVDRKVDMDQRDRCGLEVVHKLHKALVVVLRCKGIVHFLQLDHQRQQ